MTWYYLWEIAITGIFDDILVGLILVALYYPRSVLAVCGTRPTFHATTNLNVTTTVL